MICGSETVGGHLNHIHRAKSIYLPWPWLIVNRESMGVSRGIVGQYHSLGKYFVVGGMVRLNVFTCTPSIFSFLFLPLVYFLFLSLLFSFLSFSPSPDRPLKGSFYGHVIFLRQNFP